MNLPFGQDSKTVRTFDLLNHRIYLNRARDCKGHHSKLLHEEGQPGGGRFWISHKTKPTGIFSKRKNTSGGTSFIHRITARIRDSGETSYLQLIFFSWWIGVVPLDGEQFIVIKTENAT